MRKRLCGLVVVAILTLCEMGIMPIVGITPHVRLKTAQQKISASMVPADVKKVFNADLHLEGSILIGNDVADSCSTGYQYTHLHGWYHAASYVSEVDQANGIRTLDIYYFKASLFRSGATGMWQTLASDDGPADVVSIAEERIATGATVAVSLLTCS